MLKFIYLHTNYFRIFYLVHQRYRDFWRFRDVPSAGGSSINKACSGKQQQAATVFGRWTSMIHPYTTVIPFPNPINWIPIIWESRRFKDSTCWAKGSYSDTVKHPASSRPFGNSWVKWRPCAWLFKVVQLAPVLHVVRRVLSENSPALLFWAFFEWFVSEMVICKPSVINPSIFPVPLLKDNLCWGAPHRTPGSTRIP